MSTGRLLCCTRCGYFDTMSPAERLARSVIRGDTASARSQSEAIILESHDLRSNAIKSIRETELKDQKELGEKGLQVADWSAHKARLRVYPND